MPCIKKPHSAISNQLCQIQASIPKQQKCSGLLRSRPPLEDLLGLHLSHHREGKKLSLPSSSAAVALILAQDSAHAEPACLIQRKSELHSQTTTLKVKFRSASGPPLLVCTCSFDHCYCQQERVLFHPLQQNHYHSYLANTSLSNRGGKTKEQIGKGSHCSSKFSSSAPALNSMPTTKHHLGYGGSKSHFQKLNMCKLQSFTWLFKR